MTVLSFFNEVFRKSEAYEWPKWKNGNVEKIIKYWISVDAFASDFYCA
jgi:hypothetical protein